MKKEEHEKPKEEIKKTNSIADKLKAFNNSTDTKKEENKEKPKEEDDKKIGNISDKIKNLANSMNTKKKMILLKQKIKEEQIV